MKAVVCHQYGPPEVLQIAQVPKPVPTDNEVLVKIRATTVAVADIRVRGFNIPSSFWIPARLMLGITKPRKPILGVEMAGEIEAVGKNVTRFKVGDTVYGEAMLKFGAYAEYTCFAETGNIAHKPANISFELAATIPIGARTAMNYLKKGGVGKGHKVLIYGASGSVGTYAVQMAKVMGAEVTGVCSANNTALVKSLGADDVLNYDQPNFTSQLGKYDAIFVAIDKIPFALCLSVLNPKGAYINITVPVPSPAMVWASMTKGFKVVVGDVKSNVMQDLIYLKGLVEAGKLKPVLDRIYPLEQIVEAHRYVESGRKKGNVAILVQ